ncbi:MAG TPA: transglycosylase SLT domain-containing protein [Burkholderiaceae bacterium]|nr:transglycosylase SLT domain-containing protein [Burkholderiaceae bacterium]
MFNMTRIAGMALVAVTAMCTLPPAFAEKLSVNFINDDDVFMALRDAARHDDAGKAIELAARLPNYAIPSYVEYYRLKPSLSTAPVSEIRDFLARHQGSAIADRLRNDWLLELGHKRDWTTFDEQHPLFALNDDLQVKCYALMSKTVRKIDVAEEARALLTSPKDYGDGCHSLIAMLAQDGQFSADDVWAQIRLAAENGYTPGARRLSALTDVSEKQMEQAIDRPTIVLAKGVGQGRERHQLYIVALGRVARESPERAAHALTGSAHKLSAKEQALGWAQIALQASRKLAPEALADYWSKVDGAPLSNEAYQWRVRMALRAGDWKLVKSGIEAMPAALRSDPAWVYWLGRALKAEGRQEEADRLFRSISARTYFYGQLAQEELGLQISVPKPTQPITAEEIVPIAANPGFRRALKFFDMDLRFEAVREWNWQLRNMKEREHLAAAEFARQNNLLDRMVNTSDRTTSEFDFTQRYPSPFRELMYATTKALGLDMAWVYGLIRQESRFVMNARSHVGASGLMQIMPATARFVARKIGMSDFQLGQIDDTNINIQLGANYLNMVLKDLDDSQALATAAYNAGPSRSRAWRSTLARAVEGAIFAESIPFTETRGYVKNVLSNATYYAALFDGKPQSLKARLGTVAPKDFAATELP